MLKRNLSSMAMSIAEVIIGILLLVNPIGFTSGIIIAFGIVLMIMGISKTIKYFRTEPEEAAVSQILVKGLLCFWQVLCVLSIPIGLMPRSRF